MIDVKVKMNAEEIVMNLEKLEKKIQRKFVRKAMREGAKVLLNEARARVPVRTGNLQKSLGISVKTKKGNLEMHVSPRTVKESKAHKKVLVGHTKKGKPIYKYYTPTGKLVPDGYYGRFVELGTKKMSARPFLRPAFEAKGEEAVKAFRNTLKRLLDEYRG